MVIAAEVLKLGRVASFLPWPVIEGFTLRIAIIIFLQQVPAAIGQNAGPSSNAVVAAVQAITTSAVAGWLGAVVLVAVVALIMIVAPRIHPQIPGSLVRSSSPAAWPTCWLCRSRESAPAPFPGVRMIAAVRMVSFPTLRSVMGSTGGNTAALVVTIVVTVSFDLIQAVAIDVLVTAFFCSASAGEIQRSPPRKDLRSWPGREGRIAIFRIEGALFFAAAERVLERVSEIRNVEVVIIRMSQLHRKHLYTALEPAVEHARSHVARNLAAPSAPLEYPRASR